MPGIADVIIRAIDQSSQTMKAVNTQYGELNAQLTKLAQQEKANQVLGEAREKFESLTQAEKDALIATSELEAENAKLAESNGALGISMTEVNSGLEIFNKALDASKKAYAATIGESQKYAEQVRDLSAITGEGAQATSDLIQVADDFQISAEDLGASMRILTKNGLVPNKETIISLAEQYQAIQDPLAKNEFLIKNLGRASSNYTNLLSQNTDELRSNFDAQSENLEFGEKQRIAAERLRLAQDQLQDSQANLALSVGTTLTPSFAAWVDLINRAISQPETLRVSWYSFIPVFGPIITLMENYGDSFNAGAAETQNLVNAQQNLTTQTPETVQSQEEIIAATKRATDANNTLLSTVQNKQQAEESYASKVSELAKEREDIQAQIEEVETRGYEKKVGELDGLKTKLSEIQTKEKELEIERDRQSKQFILGLAQQALAADGLTVAETQALLKQGVAWGLYSQKVVDEATEAIRQAGMITSAINAIPKDYNVNINYHYSSSGSGVAPGTGNAIPRAAGGPVLPFTDYRVGENGPETLRIPTNGAIIPGANQPGGRSTGSAVTVNLTYAPGVSMNDAEAVKQFVLEGIRAAQADGLI